MLSPCTPRLWSVYGPSMVRLWSVSGPYQVRIRSVSGPSGVPSTPRFLRADRAFQPRICRNCQELSEPHKNLQESARFLWELCRILRGTQRGGESVLAQSNSKNEIARTLSGRGHENTFPNSKNTFRDSKNTFRKRRTGKLEAGNEKP